MILHDMNYHPVNIDLFLDINDFDRKGLEMCVDSLGKVSCKSCSPLTLLILDSFFDYFLENIGDRGISNELIQAYEHLNGRQKQIHCCYNGLYSQE